MPRTPAHTPPSAASADIEGPSYLHSPLPPGPPISKIIGERAAIKTITYTLGILISN